MADAIDIDALIVQPPPGDGAELENFDDLIAPPPPVDGVAPNFEYGLKQNARIGIPPALWKPDPHYDWRNMTTVHQQVHTAPDPVMEAAHKAASRLEPMMARGFQMNSEVKFFEKETAPKDNDPTYNSNVDNIKGKGDKWYGYNSFNLDWEKADKKFEGPSYNPIITVRPLLNPTDRIWLNTDEDLRQANDAVRKAHGIVDLGGNRDLGPTETAERANQLAEEAGRLDQIIDQQYYENRALVNEIDELHDAIAEYSADGGDANALIDQLRAARAELRAVETMNAGQIKRLERELQQARVDIDQLEELTAREKAGMVQMIRELQADLRARAEPASGGAPAPAPAPVTAPAPSVEPKTPAPKQKKSNADKVATGTASKTEKREFTQKLLKKHSASLLQPQTPAPMAPVTQDEAQTPAAGAAPLTPPQSDAKAFTEAELQSKFMNETTSVTTVEQQANQLNRTQLALFLGKLPVEVPDHVLANVERAVALQIAMQAGKVTGTISKATLEGLRAQMIQASKEPAISKRQSPQNRVKRFTKMASAFQRAIGLEL